MNKTNIIFQTLLAILLMSSLAKMVTAFPLIKNVMVLMIAVIILTKLNVLCPMELKKKLLIMIPMMITIATIMVMIPMMITIATIMAGLVKNWLFLIKTRIWKSCYSTEQDTAYLFRLYFSPKLFSIVKKNNMCIF